MSRDLLAGKSEDHRGSIRPATDLPCALHPVPRVGTLALRVKKKMPFGRSCRRRAEWSHLVQASHNPQALAVRHVSMETFTFSCGNSRCRVVPAIVAPWARKRYPRPPVWGGLGGRVYPDQLRSPAVKRAGDIFWNRLGLPPCVNRRRFQLGMASKPGSRNCRFHPQQMRGKSCASRVWGDTAFLISASRSHTKSAIKLRVEDRVTRLRRERATRGRASR